MFQALVNEEGSETHCAEKLYGAPICATLHQTLLARIDLLISTEGVVPIRPDTSARRGRCEGTEFPSVSASPD